MLQQSAALTDAEVTPPAKPQPVVELIAKLPAEYEDDTLFSSAVDTVNKLLAEIMRLRARVTELEKQA